MIQILALREGARPGKKTEVWFEKGLRAPTVESIFADPYEYIKRVEQSERWNIYYTVADCLEIPGRKLSEQHHIPFDVDGLDAGLTEDQLIVIAHVICEAIGVPFSQCGVIFSGHGLQVIVGTTTPIMADDEFDRDRIYYKAICDRIDLRLMQSRIRGKADRSVWSPARLMRFPLTENRKPDKAPIMGRMLNSTIERVPFTVREASGVPIVDRNQQINSGVADVLPTPDAKAILMPDTGCKFLHWCQTHPDKVSEPEWYAMVSITARFDNGRQITHKMSEGHPGYSMEETDQKISQALESSGPRLCKNIDAISGGKCAGCIHNGTRLVSPILIEGPDHIKTEKTGFRKMFLDKDTGIATAKGIDYQGLVRFFNRKHPYVVTLGNETVWEFTGTHFKEVLTHEMKVFAQHHINPAPTDQQRQDFAKEVRVTNIVPADFFTERVAGKMNFANGVYDVKNGTFHDHSMEFGFRSTLACSYDEKAECPKFMKFLGEVTLERQELIDIIQEFMGYVFANEPCHYEKALLLLGEGSNGKSTLMHVVRALAGKQGSSSQSVKAMQNDQNRYLMEGKLVNIAEENSKDSFKDTELLKNFVSGGQIGVKKLYEQPYEYANQTKLIMLCNELPTTRDVSQGFFRRCLIVPFDASFEDTLGNKNIGLKDELLGELPGIFNWVIAGYKRLLQQRRFTESAIVQEQLREYRLESDPTLAFFTEHCEISKENERGTPTLELYEHYKKWAIATNSYPGTLTGFVRTVSALTAKKLLLPKGTNIGARVLGPGGVRHKHIRYIKSLYQSDF